MSDVGFRDDVIVLPSAKIVHTQKRLSKFNLFMNVSNLENFEEEDVRLFAEKVAPFFYIKYRFINKQSANHKMEIYNGLLRTILPQYGISLIEIDCQDKKQINERLARKAIQENNQADLDTLIPYSARAELGI